MQASRHIEQEQGSVAVVEEKEDEMTKLGEQKHKDLVKDNDLNLKDDYNIVEVVEEIN